MLIVNAVDHAYRTRDNEVATPQPRKRAPSVGELGSPIVSSASSSTPPIYRQLLSRTQEPRRL